MPLVSFSSLPPDARVWVFAADRALAPAQAELLLAEVDAYLDQWRAHGQPLTVAREWRDDRFLTIAVDPTDAYASGCSIDGLFRSLRGLETRLGAALVGGGRVHFRDETGAIQTVTRDEFFRLGESGVVTRQTTVFDPTVATAGEWRERFETEAAHSWHAAVLPA
jgi:hypothetical protein